MLVYSIHIHDWIAYIIATCGFFVIGLDIYSFVHANDYISPTGWRVFLVGKILATSYIIADLYTGIGSFSWRHFLALMSFVITFAGLMILERKRNWLKRKRTL